MIAFAIEFWLKNSSFIATLRGILNFHLRYSFRAGKKNMLFNLYVLPFALILLSFSVSD